MKICINKEHSPDGKTSDKIDNGTFSNGLKESDDDFLDIKPDVVDKPVDKYPTCGRPLN